MFYKRMLTCILASAMSFLFFAPYLYTFPNVYLKPRCKKNRCVHRVARFIGEAVVDVVMLNLNVLSMQTVKIITAFTPFYLSARMMDERLQSNFYDSTHHKNICQWPESCHNVAKYGIGVPMTALALLSVVGWNEDIRLTARIYALGIPFVQSGKDVIKKLRFKSCLRPWHEDFGKEERSSGGFPSGHMATVVYMAAVWGMRHGPAWGIPLGLFSVFVFADFVNCNRHYASQLIAGAGLGLIFAYAANAVIEHKMEARLFFNCTADNQGNPTFMCTYRF